MAMRGHDDFRDFQRQTLHALLLAATFICATFVVVDWLGWNHLGDRQLLATELAVFLAPALLQVSRKYARLFLVVAGATAAASFLLFASALLSVPEDELRVVWWFLGIGMTYILLGRRAGAVYTLASMATIVIANPALATPFSTNAMTTLLLALAWCSLLFDLYTRKAEALYGRVADSESHFRILTEDIGEVVWRADRHACISYISPADQRLRGFAPDEVVGRPLSEMLTEEGAATLAKTVRSGLNAATVSMRCKDGGVRWFDVTSTREIDGDGKVIGYHGISRDVSERLRVEARLKESEERYRLLGETATEGICVAQDGLFKFANPHLQEIMAYSSDELLLQPFMKFIHGEDIEKLRENDRKRLRGETVPARYEFRVVRKDGSVRWLEMSGARIDWEGRPATLNFINDISARKELEEQVRQLAFYDPLTTLPNRRLLNDRLAQTLAASRRSAGDGALLFVDLDEFKPLNDVHGHDAGDLLLFEAAQRLLGCVRSTDTVARFGGDEFVVMLVRLSDDRLEATVQARILAEKIRAALSVPYQLTLRHEDRADTCVEHQCTASIGVTLFNNRDSDANDILRRADRAMYQAKEGGRNSIRFAPGTSEPAGPSEGFPVNLVQLEWRPAYACGNALIDEQHQALFDTANELIAAIVASDADDTVQRLLDALVAEVEAHFADEEALISAAGFPAAPEHAAIHRQLLEHALDLLALFHGGNLGSGEVFEFLAQDLVARHILGEDRDYFPYLNTPE